MGINKINSVVKTVDIWSENADTWEILDLSDYTSNKVGLVELYINVIAYNSDPSEWVQIEMKTNGEDVKPEFTTTVYGGQTGRILVTTDADGNIQWRHKYTWWEEKKVTIEIKIIFTAN